MTAEGLDRLLAGVSVDPAMHELRPTTSRSSHP